MEFKIEIDRFEGFVRGYMGGGDIAKMSWREFVTDFLGREGAEEEVEFFMVIPTAQPTQEERELVSEWLFLYMLAWDRSPHQDALDGDFACYYINALERIHDRGEPLYQSDVANIFAMTQLFAEDDPEAGEEMCQDLSPEERERFMELCETILGFSWVDGQREEGNFFATYLC